MSLDLSSWPRPERGVLFVVTGASGTGKTTLVRQAREIIPELGFSVSATTRPARAGEVDGRDYHFVDRERFGEMAATGELLEWAEVYGNHYGTPRGPVVEALERGESIVLDIDTQGAEQVRAAGLAHVSIFILPPDVATLEARLRARSTDTEAVIARRMSEVRLQLQACGSFDHLVVNDELSAAHDQFQAVLVAALTQRSRHNALVQRFEKG